MSVMFVQPAKTTPLGSGGTCIQKVRANMSAPGAAILGAVAGCSHELHFLDVTASAPSSYWPISHRVLAAGLTEAAVIDIIRGHDIDVLMITSMFTAEQIMVDRLVRATKEQLPRIRVIIGGIHASIRPEWHFEESEPDFIVIGEGEETIVELLRELGNPDGDPGRVAGLMFRNRAGELVRTRPRPPLSGIARPWALEPVLRRCDGSMRYWDRACRKSPIYGATLQAQDRPSFVLFGSRGCPFGCKYCTSTARTGKGIRHMGAEYLFDLFLRARKGYGVGVFANQADTFGQHPEDISFLKRVAEYRRRESDFDFVLNNPNAFFVRRFFGSGPTPAIDLDFISLLREAGFNVVTLAIETTCQRFNRKVNWSRTTEAHVLDLARVIRGSGLSLDVYMMYGFPGQTEGEFRADIRFGRKMAAIADTVTWHKLSLLPGTDYYDRYILVAGLEDAYRRFVRSGRGSCFFDCDELNLSEVSSQRLRDAVAEFGPGWFEEETRQETRAATCSRNDISQDRPATSNVC